MFSVFVIALRLLGTPSEAEWPGVTKLKDYHTTFPQWPIRSVAETWNMEKVDEDGLDLLHVSVVIRTVIAYNTSIS